MRYIANTVILVFSMFAQADGLSMLTDLASLEWKYRVIIVNETRNEEKVLALLGKHTAEIDDRDIVWFVIDEDRALTNYPGELSGNLLSSIRQRYTVGQGEVILIGKDGGIKSRLDRLDLEILFATIDAMPMRRYEMQN